MFEHFDQPQEAYEYRLGSALKMEQTVFEMLGAMIENAQSEQVKSALTTHRDETRQHLEILEQVFVAFGWDVDDSPCPTIEALEKEGKMLVKRTDDSFVDSIILQGAIETEHHEIAVYENLIINASAMGRQDVVDLLRRNLENEQETLELAKTSLEQVAATSPSAARDS
jgi:ferritin-like metal-binding protein YciE